MSKYYIVVEEWNYPCESGRNFLEDFDTEQEAMDYALGVAHNEKGNFYINCGDAFPVNKVEPYGKEEYRGYIITPKNCTDPYFFFAKVIEVNMFN